MLNSSKTETHVEISNIPKKEQSVFQNKLKYDKIPFSEVQTNGCIYTPFLEDTTPTLFNKTDKRYMTQLLGRVLYNGYKAPYGSSGLASPKSKHSIFITSTSIRDKKLEGTDYSFSHNSYLNIYEKPMYLSRGRINNSIIRSPKSFNTKNNTRSVNEVITNDISTPANKSYITKDLDSLSKGNSPMLPPNVVGRRKICSAQNSPTRLKSGAVTMDLLKLSLEKKTHSVKNWPKSPFLPFDKPDDLLLNSDVISELEEKKRVIEQSESLIQKYRKKRDEFANSSSTLICKKKYDTAYLNDLPTNSELVCKTTNIDEKKIQQYSMKEVTNEEVEFQGEDGQDTIVDKIIDNGLADDRDDIEMQNQKGGFMYSEATFSMSKEIKMNRRIIKESVLNLSFEKIEPTNNNVELTKVLIETSGPKQNRRIWDVIRKRREGHSIEKNTNGLFKEDNHVLELTSDHMEISRVIFDEGSMNVFHRGNQCIQEDLLAKEGDDSHSAKCKADELLGKNSTKNQREDDKKDRVIQEFEEPCSDKNYHKKKKSYSNKVSKTEENVEKQALGDHIDNSSKKDVADCRFEIEENILEENPLFLIQEDRIDEKNDQVEEKIFLYENQTDKFDGCIKTEDIQNNRPAFLQNKVEKYFSEEYENDKFEIIIGNYLDKATDVNKDYLTEIQIMEDHFHKVDLIIIIDQLEIIFNTLQEKKIETLTYNNGRKDEVYEKENIRYKREIMKKDVTNEILFDKDSELLKEFCITKNLSSRLFPVCKGYGVGEIGDARMLTAESECIDIVATVSEDQSISMLPSLLQEVSKEDKLNTNIIDKDPQDRLIFQRDQRDEAFVEESHRSFDFKMTSQECEDINFYKEEMNEYFSEDSIRFFTNVSPESIKIRQHFIQVSSDEQEPLKLERNYSENKIQSKNDQSFNDDNTSKNVEYPLTNLHLEISRDERQKEVTKDMCTAEKETEKDTNTTIKKDLFIRSSSLIDEYHTEDGMKKKSQETSDDLYNGYNLSHCSLQIQKPTRSPFSLKSSFRKYLNMNKGGSTIKDFPLNMATMNSIDLSENCSPSSRNITPRNHKASLKEDYPIAFDEKLNLSPQLESKNPPELAQEDLINTLSASFSYSTSLLLPQRCGSCNTKDENQYDFSTLFDENIGRVQTFKKLGNQSAAIRILKELMEEILKQEEVSDSPKKLLEETDERKKDFINFKLYKIHLYNLLSMELYDIKNYEETLYYTDKVLELDRYNIQALYKACQANSKLKKDVEARSILKKVRKVMQLQPYSQMSQKIRLDDISISSPLSSSNNGSFYEGLQGGGLNINSQNSTDHGKSFSKFRMSQFFKQGIEKSFE